MYCAFDRAFFAWNWRNINNKILLLLLLVIKSYYHTLAKPSYFSYSGKLQKNVKHTQNFKKSMNAYFL